MITNYTSLNCLTDPKSSILSLDISLLRQISINHTRIRSLDAFGFWSKFHPEIGDLGEVQIWWLLARVRQTVKITTQTLIYEPLTRKWGWKSEEGTYLSSLKKQLATRCATKGETNSSIPILIYSGWMGSLGLAVYGIHASLTVCMLANLEGKLSRNDRRLFPT